tara:strand:+ start:1452 stop:1706 length:255 start_codon:yes stop_codon:yes gene_type:complete
MKKQHLFTLDIGLIQELHRRVGRGHRSQFVETAVRNRLKNDEGFSLADESTLDMLAELSYRRELPKWFQNQLILVRREIDPEMV